MEEQFTPGSVVPGYGTVPQPQAAAGHAVNRPGATVYTREQKGHSIVLHLLLGAVVLWIPTIYFAVSPRHYFHV